MDQLGRFDLSTFAFEGRQDVGTWTMTGGTDAYAGLSGSGDGLVDCDAGIVEYSGEISR